MNWILLSPPPLSSDPVLRPPPIWNVHLVKALQELGFDPSAKHNGGSNQQHGEQSVSARAPPDTLAPIREQPQQQVTQQQLQQQQQPPRLASNITDGAKWRPDERA